MALNRSFLQTYVSIWAVLFFSVSNYCCKRNNGSDLFTSFNRNNYDSSTTVYLSTPSTTAATPLLSACTLSCTTTTSQSIAHVAYNSIRSFASEWYKWEYYVVRGICKCTRDKRAVSRNCCTQNKTRGVYLQVECK